MSRAPLPALRKERPNLLPAYQEARKDLKKNEDQWNALTSTGHCVILAGPGSGKTKVLTTKLASVLDEEVDFLQGVACITYSSECARELVKRLRELGIHEEFRTFIGTLHGFCLKYICRPFVHLYNGDIQTPLRIAGGNRRDLFLERAMQRVLPYAALSANFEHGLTDIAEHILTERQRNGRIRSLKRHESLSSTKISYTNLAL
jgi:superfamily I DNA/RNA helicase